MAGLEPCTGGLGSCPEPEACDRGTLEGNLEVSSAEELVAIEGYTAITGDLEIVDCESCADLCALACLSSVGKDLTLKQNDNLANLDGLNNLASVGEDLKLEGNKPLNNVDGLSCVQQIGGTLVVGSLAAGNGDLSNLNGLGKLRALGEGLWIKDNKDLPECEACELLDQLSNEPYPLEVAYNQLDDCTPVPKNCP